MLSPEREMSACTKHLELKTFAILNHKCIMSQVVVFQLVLRLNRTINAFCCNHSNSNQNNDTINTKRSMHKVSSVCKATVLPTAFD